MAHRIILAAVLALLNYQPVFGQEKAHTSNKGSLVTFVELGSVKCIPCRQMQPVMKAIEEKFGEQIKVVFYDVWKEDQKHFAQKYGIRLIPTQVFLDESGKEIMRHEGFFPEKEIATFLQGRGLKLKPPGKG
jgi:thioredoxin 1